MSERSSLERYAVTKEKGEIIFCEFEPGDTLFFLQEGNVRLMKIINYKEKSLATILSGDIFGEMSILEKAPRSATAIAETHVKLLELDKNSFLTLVQKQPTIGIKLLQNFAARIIDQKRKLAIINHSDIKVKVLDTLLLFYEKGSAKKISDKEILIKIDAKEISNWAGISENESHNTLSALHSNNYIEYDPKKSIVILKDVTIARSLVERRKN